MCPHGPQPEYTKDALPVVENCQHERITTWRWIDGTPAGLWSCAACRVRFDRIDSVAKYAEEECQEQARIIGMGAERELALMAKLERAEAALAKAQAGNARYEIVRVLSTRDFGSICRAAWHGVGSFDELVDAWGRK